MCKMVFNNLRWEWRSLALSGANYQTFTSVIIISWSYRMARYIAIPSLYRHEHHCNMDTCCNVSWVHSNIFRWECYVALHVLLKLARLAFRWTATRHDSHNFIPCVELFCTSPLSWLSTVKSSLHQHTMIWSTQSSHAVSLFSPLWYDFWCRDYNVGTNSLRLSAC